MSTSTRLCTTLALAFSSLPMWGEVVTVPAGVPLRIQVDRRYRARNGAKIEGRLIAPAYNRDQEILPVDTKVFGTVIGNCPPEKQNRVRAILDGDFVPPSLPEIRFDSLQLPGGQIVPLRTHVVHRDGTVVKMSVSKNGSKLSQQVRDMIQDRRREAVEALHHPNFGERMEKWTYAQLPWHPRMVWSGTRYDAKLTEAASLPIERRNAKPLAEIDGTPTGIIQARLAVDLDSGKDKLGASVRAVLTAPLLTADQKQVVFPEGAEIIGTVTLARPARWFARNGRLRFTFRSIQMEGRPIAAVHGLLSASEASSEQNLKVSEEGTAASSSGPGKYLAPMALGVLAAAAYGDDAAKPGNNAVVSSGFGLAARVAAAAAANPSVGRGFAYYALSKSIYFRWIARGREVRFPKNTRVEILLNER